MRIWLVLLSLAGVARAQIEDEPTPANPPVLVSPPAVMVSPPAVMARPPAAAPVGIDVVLRLNSGNEIVGRLLYGDAETVTVETRSHQQVNLPRSEVDQLRLAVIPTPRTVRESTGAHRLRLAGTGLMIAGGICEAMVALLWAVAVPVAANHSSYYYGYDNNVFLGAGAADVAFGIIGLQLLVMGGVFYTIGRHEERRYSASLLNWQF
jgi:hypothetical protein